MVWVKRIILLLLVILSFGCILKFVKNVPYFYIFIELFLILMVIAIISKKSSNQKALLINFAAIVLALGLGEAYFAGWQEFGLFQNDRKIVQEGTYTLGTFFKNDQVRGYAIAENAKTSSKLIIGNKVVYDVIYTTNQDGLRISPHDTNLYIRNQKKDFKNVFFFGCSFTLGEGVNDDETLPYLFEEKSAGEYRSYNFGSPGYGPHQMLRILETGLLDSIITDRKPSIAIYQALMEHIPRASGKYPYFLWDVNGPHYELTSSGQVEYAGKFNDSFISKIKYKLYRQLAKSYLLSRNAWMKRLIGWDINKSDIDLFVKIIIKSKQIFTTKYGGDFYVLIWSDDSENYKYVTSKLAENNIPFITTDMIFNKYDDPKEKYRLKLDNHPTELAYERIAQYLLSYLNKESLNK